MRFAKKRHMNNSLETVYEEFASIAESSLNMQMKRIMFRDMLDNAGITPDEFDRMVYERLGMSAEEALEMLDMGDTLP